jgi:hypothetical protein
MDADDEGKPPFFKSWNGLYALVLGALAASIVIFSIVSRVFE